MRRSLAISLALAMIPQFTASIRADEADPKTILDKAIKALGGEETLKKAAVSSAKLKGKIIVNGQDNPFTSTAIHDGETRFRSEFEGEFNGNDIKVVTVMNGDKAWRKLNDQVTEITDDALANQKRTVYLQMLSSLLYPLKSDKYKLALAPEEKVKGAPALAIKVTTPDGKDFTLYFDKDSSLPVKMVAEVIGWNGDAFIQETHYAAYKTENGAKMATKFTTMRDGEPFVETEVVEFKLLDKVPPETFTEPN